MSIAATSIQNSFALIFFRFQIQTLLLQNPNPLTSKSFHFKICPLPNLLTSNTSKSTHFEVCSLPNPLTSKSFRFEICSLPNPLTFKYAYFQIHSLQNLLASKIVHDELSESDYGSFCRYSISPITSEE